MIETPAMDQPTHREPLSVPVHSHSEWGAIAVMLVLSAAPGSRGMALQLAPRPAVTGRLVVRFA